ncbi:MAG: hypothetical protein KI786_19020 [Mameliella sp.]|nr:hypothetical protein [Phaeodactylibacter sp.]
MNTRQEQRRIITSSFNFLSLKQTLATLDCSKFYLYSLIRKELIKPYYFEHDEEGKPKGKPYFKIEEIERRLS